MEMNINDVVTVRLNGYGREILSGMRKDLNDYIIKAGGHSLGEMEFKPIDEEGYCEKSFQLYDFMYTFGEYMIMEQFLPFHPTIKIN